MRRVTEKHALIKLELPGQSIGFLSPVNYSKGLPWPAETQYQINIYDTDLYKIFFDDSDNVIPIRKSYWDYGRGFVLGGVQGILSMTLALYKTSEKNVDLKINTDFIKTLQRDFEALFDEQYRKEHRVDIPERYQIETISGLNWGSYEYYIDGSRYITYGLALSDQHYLMVAFHFINNNEGKKNNWKQQAQATVDFIIASFEVN